jgi:predicted RNase H-like HicB family nuclease
MSDLVIDVTPFPTAPSGTSAESEGGGADHYTAHQPLPLSWTREVVDGHAVVSVVDSLTGVFGSGRDPKTALDDLRSAKKEHREVLERQDKLSPALERQLKRLQRR